jgi:hypothetical protein
MTDLLATTADLIEAEDAKSDRSSDDPAVIDVTIDDMLLNGRKIDFHIQDSITDATIELDIDQASTIKITISDPHKRLLRSAIFKGDAYIMFQREGELQRDLEFAMVGVSKTGTSYTITFEDSAINDLRDHSRPFKLFRDKVTRAEFILRLAREVKRRRIPFYSPELHKKQPIAGSHDKVKKKKKADTSHPGFGKNPAVTVKHVVATPSQIHNMQRVFDVGISLDAPFRVMLAAAVAPIPESGWVCNIQDFASSGHWGLFQMSTDKGTLAQRKNPEFAANWFFQGAIAYYKSNPTASAAEIADHMEVSGLGPAEFTPWMDEARKNLDLYGAGKGGGSISLQRYARYAFNRGAKGAPENSWDCITRLAEEVNWRAFMHNGVLWYVNDHDLMRREPKFEFDEKSDGIETIDFDIDHGRSAGDTVTIECRANRWIAPPGEIVKIKNMGEANGRWIVKTFSRSLTDAQAEISLIRPMKPKPEPAPSPASTGQDIGGNFAGVDHHIQDAYAKAKAISKKCYPYAWGGGHANFNGPYDCSGGVSAVLHAGGMLSAPEDTHALAKWGKAGEGEFMTVWVHNAGVPVHGSRENIGLPSHTFIEFNMPGKKVEHYGTGGWGQIKCTGFGHKPQLHFHGGFTPRHWPDDESGKPRSSGGRSKEDGTDQVYGPPIPETLSLQMLQKQLLFGTPFGPLLPPGP